MAVEPMLQPATARRHPEFHRLTVTQVDRLTQDAVAVGFAVPPELAGAYDFQAGQHVTLRQVIDGTELRRTYSICAPAGAGTLRIGVKRLPGGAFSGFATQRLRPGDTVDVMTPTGRFALRPEPGRRRRLAAIAAGSGITPVLSILATVLAAEPDSECALVYGNRDANSVMFLEELADLKDRHTDRFLLLHVLSREPSELTPLHGRLDASLLGRLLDTLLPVEAVDEWWLCGPPGLVEQATDSLRARGVTERQTHAELFQVAGEPPRASRRAAAAGEPDLAEAAGTSAVTVLLDGRASQFQLDPADTVLAGALAVRPDTPYGCASGVCGACRARLRGGSVRMDSDHALDPDELAAGYVLACQSHPTSPRVTLDFDQ